jgi:dTDP-4-dehydrorhamnose reductase
MAKIVVVGAGGRRGAVLAREYRAECDVIGFNHSQVDLARPEQLRWTPGATDFDVLIKTAALTNVDHCEDLRDFEVRQCPAPPAG